MATDPGEDGPRPPLPRHGDGMPRADRPELASADASGDPTRPLVRVNVNLTPRAAASLDQACLRTHDSKTDTINRALVVYNLVLQLLERGDGTLTLQTRNGIEHVHLL